MSIDLVFIHIPKTAGTSVLHALTTAFGDDAVLTVRPDRWANIKPEAFPAAHLDPKIRVIAGHITAAQLWDNLAIRRDNPLIFSVVRDPFDRLLSLFNYLHARGRLSDDKRTVLSFANFIQSSPANAQREYLSRPGCDAEALRREGVICALPHVDWTLSQIFSRYGVGAPVRRLNVTASQGQWSLNKGDVPQSVREMCYNINSHDMALFESLRDAGPLDVNKRNYSAERKAVGDLCDG